MAISIAEYITEPWVTDLGDCCSINCATARIYKRCQSLWLVVGHMVGSCIAIFARLARKNCLILADIAAVLVDCLACWHWSRLITRPTELQELYKKLMRLRMRLFDVFICHTSCRNCDSVPFRLFWFQERFASRTHSIKDNHSVLRAKNR